MVVLRFPGWGGEEG